MLRKDMGILGSALFLLIFLMIMPGPRAMIGGAFSGASDWLDKWAPYSYIALAVLVIIPFVAIVMVLNQPAPPEPDNPLKRLKAEDVLDD